MVHFLDEGTTPASLITRTLEGFGCASSSVCGMRKPRSSGDIGDHSRGHMRFMLVEKGGVNADVSIEFLKRLAIGAKRAIFLIVDRGPAHIAKKTKAVVESLNDAPRLFYLPPYSPDRNPDDLVGKHLKADTVGRMTVTSKDDFKSKFRSSMRQLQNNPAKIRSFHQKPSLRYAA